MGEFININEILSNAKQSRTNEYVDFFFNNIVEIKDKEIYYDYLKSDARFNISIVKDSTKRILNKAYGKFMEKSWRNVIFYHIDKSSFIKYFGCNDYYPKYSIEGENVCYTGEMSSSQSKYPDEPRTYYEAINGLQNYVFNLFKEKHSSWFVRSYVYIVLIVSDTESKISAKDYYIHYWNTKYEFRRISKKKKIFNNIDDSVFVENINQELDLIETSNKDAIDCVRAYTGKLDFRNDTEENYTYIRNDLDNGIEYVVVEGAARTGKTIIALRLLGHYKESILLIMNYYFYSSLVDAFNILGVDFPRNRIFHHSLSKYQRKNGGWISDVKNKNIIPDLSFLIVDEAQRLGKLETQYYYGYRYNGIDEINEIVNCKDHRHTVFLGDDLQKLNPNYDNGMNTILSQLDGKLYRQYLFKKSIGVPDEVLFNVKFLLDCREELKPFKTNDFKICCTNSSEEFITLFENDHVEKKHYVSIGLKELGYRNIETKHKIIQNYPKELKEQDYPYLFNEEIKPNYILSTYEVISREVESVYLFLPKNLIIDSKQRIFKIKENNIEEINKFLMYHIYTIMTRATLKLNIYCEDAGVFQYLNKKIEKIDNTNNIDKPDNIGMMSIDCTLEDEDNFLLEENDVPKDKDFDYDIFIAYHGTENPEGSYEFAKEVCNYLTSCGYEVFLNGYKSIPKDEDLGFDETWHVIQRSKNFMLIFNDNVYRDSSGLIPRKYPDNKPNQLYIELKTFSALVDNDLRTNRKNLRFYYSGTLLDKNRAYNFLNKFYIHGTYGNSNCCFFDYDSLFLWMKLSDN